MGKIYKKEKMTKERLFGKIEVVNKYKHKETNNDVYIGRGSSLGNPYTSKNLLDTIAEFQCSSREGSIEKYKEYLLNKIEQKDKSICDELNKIYKIIKDGTDVYLICFCVPKKCHGNIIKKIIEEKIK